MNGPAMAANATRCAPGVHEQTLIGHQRELEIEKETQNRHSDNPPPKGGVGSSHQSLKVGGRWQTCLRFFSRGPDRQLMEALTGREGKGET